jgi:hypothetical protein
MTVLRELARYNLDLVGEVRRSDGRAVSPKLRENTRFSMERGMKIMN